MASETPANFPAKILDPLPSSSGPTFADITRPPDHTRAVELRRRTLIRGMFRNPAREGYFEELVECLGYLIPREQENDSRRLGPFCNSRDLGIDYALEVVYLHYRAVVRGMSPSAEKMTDLREGRAAIFLPTVLVAEADVVVAYLASLVETSHVS